MLKIAVKLYGISPEGNYRDELTGKKTGKNILYMKAPLAELAKELRTPEEQLNKRAEIIRNKLFKARESRERPSERDIRRTLSIRKFGRHVQCVEAWPDDGEY